MGKTVQIRDLDDATYETLRARAAAEDLSLAQYLRRELTRSAATSTMAEVLERADRRREEGGGASRAAVEAAFAEDHDERR